VIASRRINGSSSFAMFISCGTSAAPAAPLCRTAITAESRSSDCVRSASSANASTLRGSFGASCSMALAAAAWIRRSRYTSRCGSPSSSKWFGCGPRSAFCSAAIVASPAADLSASSRAANSRTNGLSAASCLASSPSAVSGPSSVRAIARHSSM
jgi:hypothetical protein